MKIIVKKAYVASLADRRNYKPYKNDIALDTEYDEKIVEDIVQFYLKYRSYIGCHMKTERKDLYDYIMNKTKCLDSYNSDFITRLKFVIEYMHYIPKCAECGCDLDLSYIKLTHFWPNFCCRKHRAINEELMTRCTDTYFEKTGYKHPMHNPDVVKKLSDTVFERTGYKYSFQNPEVKDKIKSTIKRKYNCDNIMHNKESLDKVFISTRRNKYNKMLADDKIQPLFTFQQFLDFDREKDDHLWWQCLNHDCNHIFNASIAHGVDDVSKTYARCPFCYPKTQTWTSLAEIELAEWCKTIIPENWHVYNNDDKNWNSFSMQFDILIADDKGKYRCAIEYNGIYYHSVEFQRQHNIDYDRILNKTILLENFGIPLIHIYEDEWLDVNMQKKMKAFIKFALGFIENEQAVNFDINDKIIKLNRDKYSKALPIKGYKIIRYEAPIEIKRRNNMVLNCGKFVYERIEE